MHIILALFAIFLLWACPRVFASLILVAGLVLFVVMLYILTHV